jgi:nicotinate-nucleotide pyrophosphorylase (carboxylating)
VAGLPLFVRVFDLVDPGIDVRLIAKDGDRVGEGDALAEISGPARSVLAGERVALNFLTHLSGVATLTRAYVDACAGTGSVILHTRKTLPGLRALQRYAVEVGGGRLHRGSLSDGVLIKDNHVLLAGGVGEAVRRAKAAASGGRIQAEVDTLDQLREALEAGADAVLLDNADLETVKRAVEIVNGRVPLEISGGVRLEAVPDIAASGDLLISVGRLTHSAPALDIALDVEVEG